MMATLPQTQEFKVPDNHIKLTHESVFDLHCSKEHRSKRIKKSILFTVLSIGFLVFMLGFYFASMGADL